MTLFMFLLLFWAGVATGSVEKRITGGQICGSDERQYHVQLQRENGTHYARHCGGSLISDTWILTAAHCWRDTWDHQAIIKPHPIPKWWQKFWTWVGFGKKGKQIAVESNHIYVENGVPHDIMLLKINPIGELPKIALPACRNKNALSVGKVVRVAGHGPSHLKPGEKDGGDLSRTLQCVDMKVVDCGGIPTLVDNTWERNMFCGRRANVDVNEGDSGGGVVHDGKIYGVISASGKYVATFPAQFMNVCYYKQWIEDTMRNNP